MSRKPPIELPQTDDPYVLLDVRPGASADQIRRAYLRRVKVYKPDRFPAEFRRVREAYDRVREQERWFEAWREASEVVRRAAEAAAREEAEQGERDGDASGGEPSGDEASDDEAARGDEASDREATGDEASDVDAARDDEERGGNGAYVGEEPHRGNGSYGGNGAYGGNGPYVGEEPHRGNGAYGGNGLDDETFGDDEEDVEALIAALEEELRQGRAGERDHEPSPGHDDEAPVELDAWVRGGHSAREAAAAERSRQARTSEVGERLEALAQQVHAALEEGRVTEAAARLLEPEIEALGSYPELSTLLLEVCCAAVWAEPSQFQALADRYGDLVSTHDTEYRDGALLHRRTLAHELPAWREAVADWPELHQFMMLGASLRAPAEAELGLRLGRRAAGEPTEFLRMSVVASAAAPGIMTLYVTMAERWARLYGRLSLPGPPRARPTVQQAAAVLADTVLRHRWVRWEQARPLVTSAILMAVMVFSHSPVVELLVVGAVIVLWSWRAWAASPEERIYGRVLRPTAAAWLWATHASPEELAAALEARLPGPGTWRAVLHPGRLGEYPEWLADDLALLAFSVTGPMIPLLRATASDPGGRST